MHANNVLSDAIVSNKQIKDLLSVIKVISSFDIAMDNGYAI